MKYSSDLNLGKSLCIVTYLHFPDFWLYYLLKDFDFDLRYFEWRDTENQQYSKCFVNYFQGTYLEGYSFIRLSCKKKILPWFVWWFNSLFISWHKAMPWSDAFCYLWIIYLQVKRIESILRILKQVKIQWDTQSPTGSSLTLIHSERGKGGTPENSWLGWWATWFSKSWPYDQRDPVLAFKQKLCDHCLDKSANENLQIHFEFA